MADGVTIKCVWVGEAPERPWEPGECFWSPYDKGQWVSKFHEATVRAIRRPIAVMLPGRNGFHTWFNIDSAPTNNPDGNWTVTVDLDSLIVGQKPLITVDPSINAEGLYHGWLVAGVLSDDSG